MIGNANSMEGCYDCMGTGEIRCPYCEGTGNDLRTDEKCSNCDGTGMIDCPSCNGTGFIEKW